MKRYILALVVTFALLAVDGPAAGAGLTLLGTRHFQCSKGELRLLGDSHSTLYPPASHDAIAVRTKIGFLHYSCRYIRGFVACPLDTTVAIVKRGFPPSRFDVECRGTAEEHGADIATPGADATTPDQGQDTDGGDGEGAGADAP